MKYETGKLRIWNYFSLYMVKNTYREIKKTCICKGVIFVGECVWDYDGVYRAKLESNSDSCKNTLVLIN
jgi:hypothetical protein